MSKARSRLLNTIKAPVLGWINQAVHGGTSGALTDPTSDGDYLRRVVSGVGSWLASGGAWFASFFTAADEGAARDALGLGTAAVEDASVPGAPNTVVHRNANGSINNTGSFGGDRAGNFFNFDGVGLFVYGTGTSELPASLVVEATVTDANFVLLGDRVRFDRATGMMKFIHSTQAAANRNAQLKELFQSLPTSDPTVAGELWNDSGTVKISAG
jgi:hypothetical protein